MKIAIDMRSLQERSTSGKSSDDTPGTECFAEFEVHESSEPQSDSTTNPEGDAEEWDTVQVTVVLRGRRAELQNPALSVTELVLGALGGQARPPGTKSKVVVDAPGVAVAS